MLRKGSVRFFGVALALGLAACSSAQDSAAPEHGVEDSVATSDEALSVGPIFQGPISIFPAACGTEPVATTPVTYRAGWTPWSGNGEDVSLVELGQHDGIHDVVAVQLSRTDGSAHRVIGRAYVNDADLPCFAGKYGRWYGMAQDVNLWELFSKGADLAHAMTETGGTTDPKTCVSRVTVTPVTTPSPVWSFPASCVASGLVTVGIYDALAGYKTKMPCSCPTDLPPWMRNIGRPITFP